MDWIVSSTDQAGESSCHLRLRLNRSVKRSSEKLRLSSSRLGRLNLKVIVNASNTGDLFRKILRPCHLFRCLHYSVELYNTLLRLDIDSGKIGRSVGDELLLHIRRDRGVIHGLGSRFSRCSLARSKTPNGQHQGHQ